VQDVSQGKLQHTNVSNRQFRISSSTTGHLLLAPAPKGMNALSISFVGSSHREGLYVSGSGQILGSRCKLYAWHATVVPSGIQWPARVAPSVGTSRGKADDVGVYNRSVSLMILFNSGSALRSESCRSEDTLLNSCTRASLNAGLLHTHHTRYVRVVDVVSVPAMTYACAFATISSKERLPSSPASKTLVNNVCRTLAGSSWRKRSYTASELIACDLMRGAARAARLRIGTWSHIPSWQSAGFKTRSAERGMSCSSSWR
jgi:hypothetical protein